MLPLFSYMLSAWLAMIPYPAWHIMNLINKAILSA
jgi:hypothetical protein